MRYRWFGHGHNVQITRRIPVQPGLNHGVAEKLVEPAPDLFGRGHCPAPLDTTQHVQQVVPCYLRDDAMPQRRKNILLEDSVNLAEGTLAPLLKREGTEGTPALEKCFKGVVRGMLRQHALVPPLDAGIDPFGKPTASGVTLTPGLPEADFRVAAKREPLLLAEPGKAEVPTF